MEEGARPDEWSSTSSSSYWLGLGLLGSNHFTSTTCMTFLSSYLSSYGIGGPEEWGDWSQWVTVLSQTEAELVTVVTWTLYCAAYLSFYAWRVEFQEQCLSLLLLCRKNPCCSVFSQGSPCLPPGCSEFLQDLDRCAGN